MYRIMMCAYAGVCSLAVLGLTVANPVMAQGKMKRQKSDSSMSGMGSKNSGMMSDGMMGQDGWDDYDYRDPAPLNYPMAAPGTLNLYHYNTYSGNNIMQGSVSDARMDRQRRMENRQMMGMMNRDDESMADPMPVSYPMAAPGTLDMYHYDTFRGNMVKEGSVTDARMEKEMMRDKVRFGGPMYFDRQMLADPYPVSYPFAAPGTLNMYSFKDYMANDLQEGSVSDRKMEVEQQRDRTERRMRKTTK